MKKSSKLALFNSVKGNYSQKSFQPELEMPEVIQVKKAEALAEIAKRKKEFANKKPMHKKSLANRVKFLASDGFTMEVPNEILGLFPQAESKEEKMTKAKVRELHRARIREQRGK